jgi:transcriptional regulator with XRE-family HTH domain
MSSSHRLMVLLRSEMRGSGLDQKDIAGLAGISEKHLSEIANGHAVPRLSLVDQLLTALGRELVLITREATRSASDPVASQAIDDDSGERLSHA